MRTNEELIVAFQNQQATFDEIYHQFFPLLNKETNRWTIKGMDREDIFSVASMALYESCLTYDDTKGFKFITHSITHIRYRLRDQYRRSILAQNGGNYTFLSSEYKMTTKDRKQFEAGLIKIGKEAHEVAEWNEYQEMIQLALTEMKELQREVMILYALHFEQKSDIARRMGMSPQQVNYHVNHGIEKIRYQLRRRGWMK